ncbi:MAG: hypothetical protein A3J48_04430 [Candidatus Doudnabacteria bacterium RIFCSPHIGHO2_02_FULL_46_11]|uniref:Uncharacterized protein n=1 Tax=Candidatus Doudnabacteria bacterium RIFCSPHIGHO2_02_FULL_46_11 TaxID=1817832 RepID=A0A1F5P5A4_9BACT|nr:MAG: hypothetical protein A3J48_04430 [Candidatus Doudnabacteria bacterium RIFCSPHIGHO2_02_FULL_46_11]
MGSFIEINDTLQITTEQGFPEELIWEKHLAKQFTAEDFAGSVFEFEKPNMRLYHPAPTPVSLVHNIGGKWLYWGHAHIVEQTIHAETKTTAGKFKIVKVYPPEYMKMRSQIDVDAGKEFTNF